MLSAEEARQLERFALDFPGTSAALPAGRRHTNVRGQGLEFQDYRRYQPGDDPRSIDWTVEARLKQLVVRVFRAEGRVRLHLLVDTSGSMGAGTPDKLACARKIAAALCYVAVARRDAVGVATFDTAVRAHIAPASGRGQLFRVLEALEPCRASGESAIDRALTGYGAVSRGPGLAVVLSDFFQPESTFDGFRYLLYRGLRPALVQIVSEDEWDPVITDDVELLDLEDSRSSPVMVDRAGVDAYRGRMMDLSGALEAFCKSHGLPWLRVLSSAPFDSLLTSCLQAGLLATQP